MSQRTPAASPIPYRGRRTIRLAAAAVGLLGLAGCATGTLPGAQGLSQTTQHGYVVTPYALEQVPVGSSRDQVLIALGSPSTTANYGTDVFYYISQTRTRAAAFLPDQVVDQRVVAIYFDDKDRVKQIANYGLQDGKVFDFVSRTTPTSGADQTFIQEIFKSFGRFRPKV